jgi:hypothetical protein
MGSLAFADSMTGHLIWPLVVLVLALVYRPSIILLLSRLKRFKWGDREAELQDIEAAASNVEVALQAATEPLPEDSALQEEQLRDRIERVMAEAAQWGFTLGRMAEVRALPGLGVSWDAGSRPQLKADGLAPRENLAALVAENAGVDDVEARRAAESVMNDRGVVFIGNRGHVTVSRVHENNPT